MDNTLLETLKDIIESEPLDIYSNEDDYISECVFELVDSRYEEDQGEEEDRYIGSANLLIATILLYYAESGMKDLDKLNEQEQDICARSWTDLLLQLQNEKFIRPNKNEVKESIKVVVDNTVTTIANQDA